MLSEWKQAFPLQRPLSSNPLEENGVDKRAFLDIKEVTHVFADGHEVLTNISLSIKKGAFVALVGPSGVGKSTLLRIVAGLLRPFSGHAFLAGSPAHQRLTPIGLVFQQGNLMPWRTAYENVRLPLELQGINNQAAHERVLEMLKLVGLSGFEKNYPAQLSGGMAQRVALARALVHQPSLLLLDEPFGALDALTRERMGQELLQIWQTVQVTVLMVTHSIAEAVLLADEVVVMNGRPASITHHIPIELPRPRSFEIEGTAEFQQDVSAVRAAIQS